MRVHQLAQENGLRLAVTVWKRNQPSEYQDNAAAAYLLDTLTTAWQAFSEGASDPSAEIAQTRLAITHGVRESVRAIDLLFAATGTSGIHRRHPIERFFRDVHVAARHGAGLPGNFESGGKVVLGLRPSDPGW